MAYLTSRELDEEVSDALEEWAKAIADHDRDALEWIHDEGFTCIELGGTFMDRKTHIEMELKTDDIVMKFSDVENRAFGDAVITWARQTLAGKVPSLDFKDNAAKGVQSGIEFVFTLVWRRDPQGLRVHTFHATRI